MQIDNMSNDSVPVIMAPLKLLDKDDALNASINDDEKRYKGADNEQGDETPFL